MKIYEYLWIAFTASAGTVALAGGLQNYLLKECNLLERVLLLMTCPLMLYPGMSSDLMGCVLLVTVIVIQKMKKEASVS